jgi:signal transduction histidine kinase
LPELERRRWRWGLFLVVWTLVGALVEGPFVIQRLAEEEPIPWAKVASDFGAWFLWGLFLPPIWWLTRRMPFERRRWPVWLVRNLVMGLVISFLYLALSQSFDELVAGRLPWAPIRPWVFLWAGLQYYLLVYFATVAVIHAIAFYDKLRRRELDATRLEGQLAQANLQMLRMQLHPHFLFNTLNAVSALMHRDVDDADRMISQLSDLLRLALEKDDRPKARLERELDFLHRYLAIEQIRFRDRLRVEVEVEPECLSAQVPRLVLQPLVENAIRHGIAMRSAAGRLELGARRRGDRLELRVKDDGPGVPEGHGLRLGVGLSNTRARLEQLYGDGFELVLENGDEGGFEVRLEIPFERPRYGGS